MKRDALPSADNRLFFQTGAAQLEVGQIVGPLGDYRLRLGQPACLDLLERYRPAHLLSHAQALVLCASPVDLDNAGEEEWLYEFSLAAGMPLQRHDAFWADELSRLCNDWDGGARTGRILSIAEKYWNGEASAEPVWEYLVSEAHLVAVTPYRRQMAIVQGN